MKKRGKQTVEKLFFFLSDYIIDFAPASKYTRIHSCVKINLNIPTPHPYLHPPVPSFIPLRMGDNLLVAHSTMLHIQKSTPIIQIKIIIVIKCVFLYVKVLMTRVYLFMCGCNWGGGGVVVYMSLGGSAKRALLRRLRPRLQPLVRDPAARWPDARHVSDTTHDHNACMFIGGRRSIDCCGGSGGGCVYGGAMPLIILSARRTTGRLSCCAAAIYCDI